MPTVMKKVKEDTTKKTTRKQKKDELSVSKLPPFTADESFTKSFGSSFNTSLVAQYVRTYLLNQRQGNSSVKTRGEVSGSGKKPWKQKGTGRSRVGSIRTPVWRHGGVSHGPVVKDWSLKISDEMKQAALRSALSHKVQTAKVYCVDTIELKEGRTKDLLALIKGWSLVGRTLVVIHEPNLNLMKGASNLRNVEVTSSQNLNTYQMIKNENVVFEKAALDHIKEKYGKNK